MSPFITFLQSVFILQPYTLSMQAILYKAPPHAKRIKFYIPYNRLEWRKAIKAMNTSWYHHNQKLWSVINSPELIDRIKEVFGNEYKEVQQEVVPMRPKTKLTPKELNVLTQIEAKIVLKGYSHHTLKTYKSEILAFLTYHRGSDINQLTKNQIEEYILHLIRKYQISESRQNTAINAIKFYYEQILGKDRTYYDIQRPKKSKNLPNILSEPEVKALLSSVKNLKHKTILATIYSAGLRLSELLNLRIEDIHSHDGYIFIKGAKGKKDRKTVLSKHLLVLLRKYYMRYKPAYWLFEGQEGGKYSATSVQKIFRKAVQNSGINAWATPHTLRHSFATHLMMKGVNMRYIQTMLGHGSSKTTEIYTHVLNVNNKVIESPLDAIMSIDSICT